MFALGLEVINISCAPSDIPNHSQLLKFKIRKTLIAVSSVINQSHKMKLSLGILALAAGGLNTGESQP